MRARNKMPNERAGRRRRDCASVARRMRSARRASSRVLGKET